MDMIYSSRQITPAVLLKTFAENTYLPHDATRSLQAVVSIECGSRAPDSINNTLIVFAIDVSSSMEGEKLEAVKLAINNMLDCVGNNSAVSIIPFNHIAAPPTTIKTTEAGIRELREFVRGLGAAGGTNLTDALLCAARQVCLNEKDFCSSQVVLFTDGLHNTVGSPRWSEVYSVFNNINDNPFPLYAFMIGNESDALHIVKITNMSAGGYYRHIENSYDIVSVFDEHIQSVKSSAHVKSELSIEAMPGARISAIFGVDCATKSLSPGKKYKFYLGSLFSGNNIMISCQLSIRKISEGEREDFGPSQHILRAVFTSCGATEVSNLLISRTVAETTPTPRAQLNQMTRVQLDNIMKTVLACAIAAAEEDHMQDAREALGAGIACFQEYSANLEADNYITELGNLKYLFESPSVYYSGRAAAYSILSIYQHGQKYQSGRTNL